MFSASDLSYRKVKLNLNGFVPQNFPPYPKIIQERLRKRKVALRHNLSHPNLDGKKAGSLPPGLNGSSGQKSSTPLLEARWKD